MIPHVAALRGAPVHGWRALALRAARAHASPLGADALRRSTSCTSRCSPGSRWLLCGRSSRRARSARSWSFDRDRCCSRGSTRSCSCGFPGRVASFADFARDALGIAIGIGLSELAAAGRARAAEGVGAMNITVVGTGYVGLVTGACFAEFGNRATCVDNDARKIERLRGRRDPDLRAGPRRDRAPQRAGRPALASPPTCGRGAGFAGDLHRRADAAAPDGSTDLSYVDAVARTIGEHLDGDKVVVTKSTVPVKTAERGAASSPSRRRRRPRGRATARSRPTRSSCARAARSRTSCAPTAS